MKSFSHGVQDGYVIPLTRGVSLAVNSVQEENRLVATGGFGEGKWELASRCKVIVTEIGKL